MMATRSEARQTRKELRRHSRRIEDLIERCISQVCDADVAWSEREKAERNLWMLHGERAASALQLERVGEALNAPPSRSV